MPATLEGVDELIADLRRLGADVGEAREVHLDAARPVFDEAKRRSRSRRVRASGRVTASRGGARIAFGRQSVPWAAPSHFGHRPRPQGGYMLPNPFAYDALDVRADEVVARYAAFVDRRARALDLS